MVFEPSFDNPLSTPAELNEAVEKYHWPDVSCSTT